ncbi:unnamed protein product, partial [Trichogramma brassicae]
MFSRSFLVFFGVVALFALAVAAVPVIDDEEEISLEIDMNELDDVESKSLLAVALKVLTAAFKWAVKHCLKEAAQNCKQHWKHPKALISCASRGSSSNNNNNSSSMQQLDAGPARNRVILIALELCIGCYRSHLWPNGSATTIYFGNDTTERKRCAQGNFRVGFITTKERRKWRRNTGEERKEEKRIFMATFSRLEAAAAVAVAATRCRAPHGDGDDDDDDDVTFERLYIMLRRAHRLYALVITEKEREREAGSKGHGSACALLPPPLRFIHGQKYIYIYTQFCAPTGITHHTVRGAHHAECVAGRYPGRRDSTASATRVKVQSSLSFFLLAQPRKRHSLSVSGGRLQKPEIKKKLIKPKLARGSTDYAQLLYECTPARAYSHRERERDSAQAAAPPRSVTRLALYYTTISRYICKRRGLLSSPLPSCRLIYDIALQWAVQLFNYAIFHSSRKIEECAKRSVESCTTGTSRIRRSDCATLSPVEERKVEDWWVTSRRGLNIFARHPGERKSTFSSWANAASQKKTEGCGRRAPRPPGRDGTRGSMCRLYPNNYDGKRESQRRRARRELARVIQVMICDPNLTKHSLVKDFDEFVDGHLSLLIDAENNTCMILTRRAFQVRVMDLLQNFFAVFCFVIYTHSYVRAANAIYIKRVYRAGGVICSSRNYRGQLPNLRDIFRPEAIDWLLTECVNDCNKNWTNPKPFVDFVIASGYKDETKVDKDGKPMLRRTTAVHRAKFPSARVVPNLFEIYDRFDLNYINESGRTHFHVACSYGCDDAIEKFLENGVDPNCHVEKTGDSPLHLVLLGPLYHNTNKICRILLENGVDPNSANAKGLTPLHSISLCFDNDGLVNMLFEISEANHQTLQIDARDNSGNTPLHMAVECDEDDVVEFLLRRGADPNLANGKGFTSLHLICEKDACCDDDDLAEMFFNVCDENHQLVQVDALDKLGRTPLQWAVANLLPNAVKLVLERGADLSRFVFPILNDLDEMAKDMLDEQPLNCKLGLASRAMIVVEHLEKGGYNLNRSDALKIMTLFAKHELFDKSSNDVECCNSFRRACRRNFQRAARLARHSRRRHHHLDCRPHSTRDAARQIPVARRRLPFDISRKVSVCMRCTARRNFAVGSAVFLMIRRAATIDQSIVYTIAKLRASYETIFEKLRCAPEVSHSQIATAITAHDGIQLYTSEMLPRLCSVSASHDHRCCCSSANRRAQKKIPRRCIIVRMYARVGPDLVLECANLSQRRCTRVISLVLLLRDSNDLVYVHEDFTNVKRRTTEQQ